MTFRHGLVVAGLLAASFALPARAPAQDAPSEVAELRRRVAAIRAGMPAIIAAAEYAADLTTRDTLMRFLIPAQLDAAIRLELYAHAGGPPDVGDAEDPSTHGIVLLPVRAWEGGAIGAAVRVQRWQDVGRPVIVLGSVQGKPKLSVGRWLLDNGAPNDSRELAAMNGIAEMVTAWTFYAEFVAAATRKGWQPGVYLSVMAPGASEHNRTVRFRMPATGDPVPAIPAGQLGNQYLAAVDSLLRLAARPDHQAAVRRAADTLRSLRAGGARLYVASCGHYPLEELPRDTVDSPFRPIDWRWDIAGKLAGNSVRPGDAMLWFGYGGYDCPNAAVSAPFADAGLNVVLVSNGAPVGAANSVVSYVPLAWTRPDAVASIPFEPGALGPVSSVETMVHYLWLRRLVAAP